MSENQVEIKQFGPYRIIGMSYVGKNENNEVPQLWERELMPRSKEIQTPERSSAFGICRCIPGKTDGTFEYVAAVEANAEAAVPDGMVAVEIPKSDYVVIPVSGLGEVRQAWGKVPEKLAGLTGWSPFCGPAGCECASHPCFEYYPPEFEGNGPLFLYIPVKQKTA
jgi:predicted transcriptional regulator YdeE